MRCRSNSGSEALGSNGDNFRLPLVQNRGRVSRPIVFKQTAAGFRDISGVALRKGL